jgi:hypothetical protein
MPLESSSSKEVISRNIKREVEAGRPQDQAVAIAMNKAGKSKSDSRFPQLDSMLDALFAPKKDGEVMGTPPNKDCKPFSDNSERSELRTGALSKKE